MSISVRRTTVVRVHDKLDASGARQLEQILLDLVDHQGITDLLVDLSEVGSLDEDLESMLAGLRNRIDRVGGSLELRTAARTRAAVAVSTRIPTFVPIAAVDRPPLMR